MSEEQRGRLFLVVGADAELRVEVAATLAQRSPLAIALDGTAFDSMVVSGREAYDEPPSVAQLRQLLLRWSASIATAETYLLEGFDAVISDAVLGSFLDDFLDLATPEPVHVVVLDDGSHTGTPGWGLWVPASLPAEAIADLVLADLDGARVLTDPG